MSFSIEALRRRLSACMNLDARRLAKRLQGVKKLPEAKQASLLETISVDLDRAALRYQARLAGVPKVTFPANLPVSQKQAEIARAISEHQVVIIAGETGSGKTTQIPKICLALGRGVKGYIGHTQPRRLAARTVAARIAQEMTSELGQYVGYKVRFTDQVSEQTHIKLMTDGILLAEIQ
ncbi:MAG: ATP-dependent RNA helicase HrpA, partial [Aeromonas sp.]